MTDIIMTDKAYHSVHNYKINIHGQVYLNGKSLYTLDTTLDYELVELNNQSTLHS